MFYPILCDTAKKLIDGSTEYTVSWDMILGFILAVCGFVITSYTAIEVIEKIKKRVQRPEATQNERISSLENCAIDMKKELADLKSTFSNKYEFAMNKYDTLIRHYYDTKLQHDKAIEDTNEGLLILIRAVSNLTYHTRYGNHEQEMTDSLHEMEEYTTKRAKASTNLNIEAKESYEEVRKKMESDY